MQSRASARIAPRLCIQVTQRGQQHERSEEDGIQKQKEKAFEESPDKTIRALNNHDFLFQRSRDSRPP